MFDYLVVHELVFFIVEDGVNKVMKKELFRVPGFISDNIFGEALSIKDRLHECMSKHKRTKLLYTFDSLHIRGHWKKEKYHRLYAHMIYQFIHPNDVKSIYLHSYCLERNHCHVLNDKDQLNQRLVLPINHGSTSMIV